VTHLRHPAAAVAALLLLSACGNAGSDRTVGITATSVVTGGVFFDANGSGIRDAGDLPVQGVRVAVVTPIARDTVRAAVSGIDGSFRIAGIPVGSYAVVLDPASVGDSVEVEGVSGSSVTLAPDDSVTLEALVRYPLRSIAAVRAGTLGERVFVEGVVLHALGAFSDTLLHVVDGAGALRATRVRSTPAVAGDSVRLRGRIAERDGQRVLDDVTVFVVGATFIPTAPVVSTANAATASGGTLDAALVRVLDAAIVDTATVAGSLRVRVTDGSGNLTMLLDRQADPTFRPPFAAGAWTAGRRFDLVGVLVPVGSGTWALRPRSGFDLTPR
jgi:hypothetical protein